jgi:1,5-anhydro-D-fructose reductase (1,5-anhydro-D-mannitol-forming)
MSRPVGWGIVGLGRIAERIATALTTADNAALVAVCSRSDDHASDFAARHQAKAGYASYEAMLADPAVEAIFISSPNALHAPQTLAAAGAGKHVFCEKPMALTAAECRAMLAACRRAGVQLGIGYHLRQHPVHREIRRLVECGVVGAVQLARAHFFVGTRYDRGGWKARPELAGGGAIMSAGVHSLDLLRYLVGQEVVEVTALADAPRIEEVVTCLLRFERGALAYADTSRIIPFASNHNDVSIYGSRAAAVATDTLLGRPAARLDLTTDDGNTREEFEVGDLYKAEIEEFGRAIRQGDPISATGWDGVRAAEITEAVYASIRGGGTVKVAHAG